MSSDTARRWLWITPEITDELTTGALRYSRCLADAVAKSGVDVTLVGNVRTPGSTSSTTSGEALTHIETVEATFRRPWMSLGSRLPNQAFACSAPAVRSRVRGLIAEGAWDVIVIDGLQAAWVTPLLEKRSTGATVVYLSHNHESSMRRATADETAWTNPRKLLLELEARKTAWLERRTTAIADVVTSITERDRDRFELDAPTALHVVLPPGWSGTATTHPRPARERPRRVGILGSFDWHVKQEGLRRFLSAGDRILHEAGVELHVAGRMPQSFRDELVQNTRSTTMVGWVDDATEFLGSCRIGVVAEALGGGFKLKALDYVFNSVTLACLATNLAGLPLVQGESVITATDEESLARAVVSLIDDVDELDRRAAAALERCAQQFSWTTTARRLVDAAPARSQRG